jgi:hypothetical protein
MGDTLKIAVCVPEDKAFNKTKTLTVLIPAKETTTGADLYEEVAGKSGYLSTETCWTSVTDVAPSMVRRNSGVSSLVTNDVENRGHCDLIICLYLIKQDDLCPKSVRLTNVDTMVSKLVNFVGSKGTNHPQLKISRVIWNLDTRLLSAILELAV